MIVHGLLLAAGRGRRFGADKLLHPLADGMPIALRTAATLRAALPTVTAVVRPAADALAARLQALGLTVVRCAEADRGMGHSLAAGVAASADADVWLIALADMPFVSADTLRRLCAAAASPAALVAPRHTGRRGHPVLIGRAWRDELLALTGDQGARALLQREAHALVLIDVDDPGVLRDIDTPADLGPQA